MQRGLVANGLLIAALSVVILGESTARADCQPATRQSTCFDADSLWIPAAPSRFVGIAQGRALALRTWALGFDTTYLSRPVVLGTGSPDPNGRDVRVVDDVVDVALAAAYSPAKHLELTAIVPAALYRSGTGLVGVTSRSGPQLPSVVLRDVRLGAAHDLILNHAPTSLFDVGLAARLDVVLPTGNDDAFAGERGPVVAPSLSFDLRRGIFFAGAEGGARLRRPIEFGGARLGTQLVSSLGIGVNLLPEDELAVAVESSLMPTFLSQRRTLPDGTAVTEGHLTPAEWMLSARTRIDRVVLTLGAGAGLPWSSETRRATDGEEATTHFAGLSTPRFRAALVVRYVPGTGAPVPH